jgi:hypothetical protein
MQVSVMLAVDNGTLTSEAEVADSGRRILQEVSLRRSLADNDHRDYEDLNVTIQDEIFGFISAFSALMVLMFLMI